MRLRARCFVVDVTGVMITTSGFNGGLVSAVVAYVDFSRLASGTLVLNLVGRIGSLTVITLSDIDLGLVRLLLVEFVIDVVLVRAGAFSITGERRVSGWVFYTSRNVRARHVIGASCIDREELG